MRWMRYPTAFGAAVHSSWILPYPLIALKPVAWTAVGSDVDTCVTPSVASASGGRVTVAVAVGVAVVADTVPTGAAVVVAVVAPPVVAGESVPAVPVVGEACVTAAATGAPGAEAPETRMLVR